MWITCPDCGSRIGIIVSVGKAGEVAPVTVESAPDRWPPEGIGGTWIREGRDSRWEIKEEPAEGQ